MARSIFFTPGARKERRRLPADVRERLDRAISEYAENPRAARNVRKLRGREGQLHIRVGNWRVIIEDDGTAIHVLAIRHRNDAYRR